jgi:uncharacterized membrane protein
MDISNDSKLSWKAKGLYAAIAAKKGKFNQRELRAESTDGETSVSRGIKELVENGYLVQERNRVNGRFVVSNWMLPKE